jgi:Tol biopolymer transport system component
MRRAVALGVAILAALVILSLWRLVDWDESSDGPDGRIAFVSDASGDHEVWVIDPDGSELLRLTGEETPPNTGPLSWSPDGQRIVFTADDGEDGAPADIYVVEADRPGARRITHTDGEELLPQFLPDGTIFYWDRSTGGGWIIDDDGSNRRHVDGAVPSGVLSPDGTVVLRTLGTGRASHYNTSQVTTSDLGATYHDPLTEEFGYTEVPSWSADGALIAIVCADVEGYTVYPGVPEENEPRGICVLRPDGTGLRRVVEVGDAPTLSPDGRWVAYLGVSGPSIVGTEGGEPRLFLAECGCLQVGELAWSPRQPTAP